MKAGREHRVWLSAAAVAVVERISEIPESEFAWVHPLSNMAMLVVLKRWTEANAPRTGSARPFGIGATERTSFPHEVAKMALAHTVGDKVEAAYRRGDLLQKRRQLMDGWARFCGTTRL